ncbi:MAG: FmdB family zinc ribbon protein [Mycobacterium sp.]
MPTYSYACTECGNRFDVVQAFTDDALTTCPQCSGRLRKLFNSVGVVFKGSGFYRTDSRESAKSSTNGSAKTSSSSGSDASSSDGTSGSSEKSTASSDKSDSAKSAAAASS